MKNFPTAFTAQKNKKTGATPVWFLECTLGSQTVYLSDMAMTLPPGWPTEWDYTGVTLKPCVKSFGQINDGIGAGLDDARISDFSVSCIIDHADQNNIENLLNSCVPEKNTCTLWLWFAGLNISTDPPQAFWRGYIRDYSYESETVIRIDLEDCTARLDKLIGNIVATSDTGSADPDDVGRMKPIIYGSHKKVACLAIDAGAMTTLNMTIDSPDIGWLHLADPTEFATGRAIQVDDERMLITYKSGGTSMYVEVTRGYNGTTATPHQKGATVWERRSTFTYLVADHPVSAIGNVYGRVGEGELRIGGSVTINRYTGQPGNEHPSYPGKAVITLPGYITAAQAVDLGITDAEWTGDYMSIGAAIAILTGSHSHGQASSAPVVDAASQLPPKLNTPTSPWWWAVTASIPFPSNSNIQSATFLVEYQQDVSYIPASPFPGDWGMSIGGVDLPQGVLSGSVTFTAPPNDAVEARIWCTGNDPVSMSGGITITSAKRTGYLSGTAAAPASGVAHTYNQTGQGDVWKSTPGSISGNSTANTIVADTIMADVDGYADNASGTYTGTANALITRPDHVLKHFAAVHAGCTAAAVIPSATSAHFASGGYRFDGAIRERKAAWAIMQEMARQCGCRLHMALNAPKLQLITYWDMPSVKTITADMVRMNPDGRLDWRRTRSRLPDLMNAMTVRYDRDRSDYRAGEEAYKANLTPSDTASQADYGTREWTGLAACDWLTDQITAQDVASRFLTRHKARKWVHEFTVFLDNCELEAGDSVTLAFAPGSPVCEVMAVHVAPGNMRRNDTLVIEAVEY